MDHVGICWAAWYLLLVSIVAPVGVECVAEDVMRSSEGSEVPVNDRVISSSRRQQSRLPLASPFLTSWRVIIQGLACFVRFEPQKTMCYVGWTEKRVKSSESETPEVNSRLQKVGGRTKILSTSTQGCVSRKQRVGS